MKKSKGLNNILASTKGGRVFLVGIIVTFIGGWYFYTRTANTSIQEYRFLIGLLVSFIGYYFSIVSAHIIFTRIEKKKELAPLLKPSKSNK